jgi:hypothetical protein
MAFSDRVRKLDIFKKVPKDLSEGTNIGGFISILTISFIFFFSFSELRNYFNP